MESKYAKEFVMDITQTFIQDEDFSFIQDKIYEGTNFPLPHKVSCYTQENNSRHGIIDDKALSSFGERLLNDQLHAEINAYHLTLPSVNEAGSNHALALMVDKKNKEIWYQDSYGIDMRKELRDFFKELFPGYKIGYNPQIQQDKAKGDNSCFILSAYNLVDMWHRKSGHPELMKEYESIQARAAAWEHVKLIEKQAPKPQKSCTFKINKISSPADPKKYMIEQNRNTQRDFKYSLPKLKNYKLLLQEVAAIARKKHEIYKGRLIEGHQLKR